MPNIGDILDTVDMMKVDPVVIDEDRCVVVRNRNAKCRRCADACGAGAIFIARNSIRVEADACLNCGSCASVCPDSAITMVEPKAEQVDSRVKATADGSTGLAVIACSRRASKGEADPDRFAEVPCLAHLREDQIIGYVADGLNDIVLVDGCCSTCRLGYTSDETDEMIDSAASILEAAQAEAVISRMSDFPSEVLIDEEERYRGKSRRGLARQTGSYMGKIAGNVVRQTLENKLGLAESEAEKWKRRRAVNGKLPTFTPDLNYRIIDDLVAMAESDRANIEDDGILDSRRFGDLCIDLEKCSGCAMCITFCPTEALSYDEYDIPEDDSLRYIEFNSSDCTQCRICVDVCIRHCLEIGSKVNISEICDPAPRVIAIPKPF